jgi:hypothetical protein
MFGIKNLKDRVWELEREVMIRRFGCREVSVKEVLLTLIDELGYEIQEERLNIKKKGVE